MTPDAVRSTPGEPTRPIPAAMADRLIVALDVETAAHARALVHTLGSAVSFFKIGFRLQITPGFESLVQYLLDAGKNIFLDAKMYDIPQTVETAVRAAAERGMTFITVHGDEDILHAAVRGRGSSRLKIFAVTVLTSLDDAALHAMGYALTARDLVRRRADTAAACGCDGIIASADDDPDALRALARSDRLLIATPGIRLPDNLADDQKRTASPSQAIEHGADYIVVGRPIILQPDPLTAAHRVITDMEQGQRRRDAAGSGA